MSETAKIAEALVAFQAEMPTVAKGKTATVRSDKGNYSYTYAGLAEVSHAALPLLTKHGLAFVCTPELLERGPVLTGILLHTSGESLRGSLPLATGGTPQQTGSALTYARRYLFGAMTGLITDDDDDGSLASRKAPAKKAERLKTTPPDDPFYTAPPPADSPLLDTTSGLAKTMFAAISKAGIPEEERIEQVALIIGRPITSSKQMTDADAQHVIDHLKKQGVAS
jgi:hypothetical protein